MGCTSAEPRERTDIALRLRSALRQAVTARPVAALLLSGGVDSSLLAALDPCPVAITVVLKGHGSDLQHAQQVAACLRLDWHALEIERDEAIHELMALIRLLRSYDPGLLNDVPVGRALRYAASLGLRRVRTGDAADTLFAGYAYLHGEPDFRGYLRRLIPEIRLASSRIGRALGLRMDYPYLHPAVLDVARALDVADNVARFESEVAGDAVAPHSETRPALHTWGKLPIRRAATGLLPRAIAWRQRTDLEFGSGMHDLASDLAALLTPDAAREVARSGHRFWPPDRAPTHRALYWLYTRLGLAPEPPRDGEYACTWCGAGVVIGRRHCATCGAYPADGNEREGGIAGGNESDGDEPRGHVAR